MMLNLDKPKIVPIWKDQRLFGQRFDDAWRSS